MTTAQKQPRGGYQLAQLRDLQGLKQRDIERMTEGVLNSAQVSRIETGKIAEPTMRDLVLLGELYGKTPNEVAEMFGYWHPRLRGDEQLEQLAQEVAKLPPKYRFRVYDAFRLALLFVQDQAHRDTGLPRVSDEDE